MKMKNLENLTLKEIQEIEGGWVDPKMYEDRNIWNLFPPTDTVGTIEIIIVHY